MGIKVPKINVYRKIKRFIRSNPLIRDTVCLIGAFETDKNTNTPVSFNTIEEARTEYGTNTSIDANACLEQILGDNTVDNVIIVNTTTKDGSTYDRTLTKAKLQTAVEALDLIDFDILYIANELTDTNLEVITDFAAERFENKKPFGFITAFTRASNTAYGTTSGLLGDFCYASVIQRLTVNQDELSLLESGAYITKVISQLNINESLTAKTIPEITGINSSDVFTFETGGDGETLTEYGYLLFRLINATTNTYEAVNSSNPNGLDLYITRVTNAIVNDMALREFLGEINNTKTLELIKTELNRIYSMYMDLNCIAGMNFDVNKKSEQTVEVIINSILFDDIITEIDVYITIEVE